MHHEPKVSSIVRARDFNEQRGPGQRLLELRVFEAISCQDFSCISTPNFFAAVVDVLPRDGVLKLVERPLLAGVSAGHVSS